MRASADRRRARRRRGARSRPRAAPPGAGPQDDDQADQPTHPDGGEDGVHDVGRDGRPRRRRGPGVAEQDERPGRADHRVERNGLRRRPVPGPQRHAGSRPAPRPGPRSGRPRPPESTERRVGHEVSDERPPPASIACGPIVTDHAEHADGRRARGQAGPGGAARGRRRPRARRRRPGRWPPARPDRSGTGRTGRVLVDERVGLAGERSDPPGRGVAHEEHHATADDVAVDRRRPCSRRRRRRRAGRGAGAPSGWSERAASVRPALTCLPDESRTEMPAAGRHDPLVELRG